MDLKCERKSTRFLKLNHTDFQDPKEARVQAGWVSGSLNYSARKSRKCRSVEISAGEALTEGDVSK